MANFKKRVLPLFMALVMVISMMPVNAFAAEEYHVHDEITLNAGRNDLPELSEGLAWEKKGEPVFAGHDYTNDTDECGVCKGDGRVEHEYDVVVTAPTCTKDGCTTYTCKNNKEHSYVVTAEGSALGHTVETVDGQQATCTDTGLTEGSKCTVCGETLTAQDVVDALGHTAGDVIVENTAAADCENAGSYDKVVYCTVCENELSRETITVDALGHTAGDVVVENKVDPNCENAGSYDKVVYCTVCENELSRETITVDALGHTAGDVIVENTAAADCENAGSYDKVVYCTVCENELSRETITVDALGHTAGDVVVENKVDPNCENAGSYDKVVYCTVCGEELSRNTITVDALGHSWSEPVFTWNGFTCTATFSCGRDGCSHIRVLDATVSVQTTAPTCTEDGVKVYTAKVTFNGTEYTAAETKSETLPAIQHNYEGGVTTAPTCTEDGVKTYVCKNNAEHTYTESVTKLGHDMQYFIGNTVSCTEDGHDVYKCTRCEHTETQVTEAKGHSYSELGVVVKAATCTEPGEARHYCMNKGCNNYKTIEIPATGHTEVVDAAVDATCTTAGKTAGKHCSVCNVVLIAQTAVDALDHSFTNYNGNNNATCTQNGTETAKCNRCDETNTRTVENSKLGHSFTNYNGNNNATCTQNGTETATCDRCDETDTRTVENSKLAHSFTNAKSATKKSDATCEAAATYYVKCDNCTAISDTKTVADGSALGHSYTNYVGNDDATCTQNGTETATCDRCDETDTRTVENSALSHNYQYNNQLASVFDDYHTVHCTRCNAEDYESHDTTRTVTVAPTCTEWGYTQNTCFCGKKFSFKNEWAAPTGHSHGEWSVTTNATCTEAGSKTRSCACGDTQTETIPATGHSFTTTASDEIASSATCEAAATYYVKCDNCTAISGTKTVAVGNALGHTEVVDASVAATCTTEGKTEGKHCSVCNETLVAQQTVSALGHNITGYNENAEYNYHYATCSRCGEFEEKHFTSFTWDTNALKHQKKCACGYTEGWEWHDRDMLGTCKVCGRNILGETTGNGVMSLSASASSMSNGTDFCHTCDNEKCHNGKIHTCTAACYNQTWVVVETKHVYDSGVVTTAPTCEGTGVMTYTCIHNAEHSYTEEIPATGHHYELKGFANATATEDGYLYYVCSGCDATLFTTLSAGGNADVQTPAPDNSGYSDIIDEDVPQGETPDDLETSEDLTNIVDEETPLAAGELLNIDEFFAYLNGYEDSTIRPEKQITRAEFVTIIFRLLNDDVRMESWSTESRFTDVTEKDWFFNEVATCDNLGILDYYEDNFEPNKNITRAEVAYIVAMFTGDAYEGEENLFDDIADSFAADAINDIATLGIIGGDGNGKFRPNDTIKRDEVAKIINLMLGRDAEKLVGDLMKWSDNADESKWWYDFIRVATNSFDSETFEVIEEKKDWKALEKKWAEEYAAMIAEAEADDAE